MKKIAVLLADDHMLVREGLRALLEAERDMTVVGEASSGREAVELTHRLHPDVVVMDIGMPLLNGLEATRQIRKIAPSTRVLILSGNTADQTVRQVAEIGAAGYVVKQTSAEVLARAVREADKGGVFFNPPLNCWLRQRNKREGEKSMWSAKRSSCLSDREMEVLQSIAERLANKQIAAELGIAIQTVENHRGSPLGKLHFRDTAGLARHAVGAGAMA